MSEEKLNITLPASLKSFLDAVSKERGLASVDECVRILIEEAKARQPRQLKVNAKGTQCTLTRLQDDHFRAISKRCITIDELDDVWKAQISGKGPLLAQTYAVCKSLFGERGRWFDQWKGGFSFPLALTIENDQRQPAYLLNVYNLRSGVEFRVLQSVAEDDSRLQDDRLYKHDDPDFSTERLSFLIFYLIGFIEGYSKTCGWNSPFLLQVQSNLILYGYSPDEGFFNRSFDDPEEYEATRLELSQTLPEPAFYLPR